MAYVIAIATLFVVLAIGLGLTVSLRHIWPLFALFSLIMGFGLLNVTAKRWRSAGLSGWPVAVAITALLWAAFWISTDVGLWTAFAAFVVSTLAPPRSAR